MASPAKQIRPQLRTGDTGCSFDCNHPLCGYFGPIRYRRLADTDFARELGNAACGVNGAIKAIITHLDLPSGPMCTD